jgi:hypothetical protein
LGYFSAVERCKEFARRFLHELRESRTMAYLVSSRVSLFGGQQFSRLLQVKGNQRRILIQPIGKLHLYRARDFSA